MWPIIRFLIILGILIFVHELGHFAIAKLSGIYVHRFALGFGPRIIGYKGKETDYSIMAVPLGGYVKMAGQEDLPTGEAEDKADGKDVEEAADETPDIPEERKFSSKPIWVRSVLIMAGPAMNFIVGFMILSAMYYTGIDVPVDKAVIGAVMKDMPAVEAGI